MPGNFLLWSTGNGRKLSGYLVADGLPYSRSVEDTLATTTGSHFRSQQGEGFKRLSVCLPGLEEVLPWKPNKVTGSCSFRLCSAENNAALESQRCGRRVRRFAPHRGQCSSVRSSKVESRCLGAAERMVLRGTDFLGRGNVDMTKSALASAYVRERSSFKREGLPWTKKMPFHFSAPLCGMRPRIVDEEEGQMGTRKVTPLNCIPSFKDTPPKRDTGIASEKEWNISLQNQPVAESGLKEDGSTWFRESGEDLGENGFRSRWTVMGGRSGDGAVEWKETWWEKSDWTGYKELGAEKSGRNTLGDSWWETWQEVYREDEWSGLARIEKSAHKQAKSRTGGVWNEKWWEKYNAKGWAEKGAHKYGKLNDQGWWEKWGEQYDGQGAVVKWTDKWAESDSGTRWGDKWDERFNNGVGMRQGETWHVTASGNRWSRTWGEEHFGTGEVHKYGKSTSGELWDITVMEPTYYEAEPHYGWVDAVENSAQLLSIEIRDRPPPASGSYSDLDPLS